MSYLDSCRERCRELLQIGRFGECLKVLESQASNFHDQREKWIYDCDILVCRFVNDIKNTPKDETLYHQYICTSVNKFLDLLLQLRGLPASLCTISIELAVVYNLCILQLHLYSGCVKLTFPNVLKELGLSITRVVDSFKRKKDISLMTEEDIGSLAIYCMKSNKTLGTPDFLYVMTCCCSLLGLVWLLQGSYESSEKLLLYLHSKIDYSSQSIKDFPFCLSFDCEQCAINNPHHIKKVVTLLLDCNYLSQKNYRKCVKVASESEDSSAVLGSLQAFGHMKLSEPQKALDVLFSHSTTTESNEVKAIVASIEGDCLALLGKGHGAIQRYRVSLRHDFTSLAPLYKIALEYRKMSMFDAELESLNLLVTALENSRESKSCKSTQGHCLMFGLSQIILQATDLTQKVTLPDILYIMARRCMELDKFQIAAEKLLDLIALLVDDDMFMTLGQLQFDTSPSIHEIHLQAVYALIKCERYEEATILCDRLIAKHVPSCLTQHDVDNSNKEREEQSASVTLFLYDKPQGSKDNSLSVPNNRKRLRSSEKLQSGSSEGSLLLHELCKKSYSEDVAALIYKSDCLLHSDNEGEALDLLNRAISSLENVSPSISLEQQDTLLPQQKRIRLDSDGVQTSSESNKRTWVPPHFALLAQAYGRKAKLLATKGKLKDALHYCRLSILTYPDSADSNLNYCSVLVKLGHLQEGYYNWLQFRNLDIKMDGFQTQHLINQTQTKLRNEEVFTLDQRKWFTFDKAALEYLLKRRQDPTSK